MRSTIVVTRSEFERALEVARTARPQGVEVVGLAAPVASWVRAKAAEVWGQIEEVLVSAWDRGSDWVSEKLGSVLETVNAALVEVGNGAAGLQAELLDRLAGYVDSLVSGALARIKSAISVGDVTLPLTGVAIAHKIVVTGSLKLSITEAVGLTGEGELTVEAFYGQAPR